MIIFDIERITNNTLSKWSDHPQDKDFYAYLAFDRSGAQISGKNHNFPFFVVKMSIKSQHQFVRIFPFSWFHSKLPFSQTAQKCYSQGAAKDVGAKGVRSLFVLVFGTLSVTFWSLFLMLLSLFSSLFCQTPFAELLLQQGVILLLFRRRNSEGNFGHPGHINPGTGF